MKSDELDTLFTNIADSIRAKEDSTDLIDATDFPQRIASISMGFDFPSGGVIIWSGTVSNIPNGWALCDGTNGTPDLRDRFVLGAGEHGVGDVGGEENVTLTVAQMPLHVHDFVTHPNSTKFETSTSGISVPNSATATGSTRSAGSSQPHNNMPPYYALCYIMKL